MAQLFMLMLRVAPGRDGIRDLRALLKVAWREFGLRAIDVREITNTTSPRRSAVWCKLSSAPKETKMDMSKYSGTSFIKCDDVRDGPLQEKITDVSLGQFGKPDITFASGAKLSLNATNNKTLMRAFGTDSEGWLDQTVELFLGEIEYQNKMQEAVLVRAISKPDLNAPKKRKPKAADSFDIEETF